MMREEYNDESGIWLIMEAHFIRRLSNFVVRRMSWKIVEMVEGSEGKERNGLITATLFSNALCAL